MSERILIVDDEQIIRESLSFVLNKEGYEVDEASNGVEAIEKQEAEPYDLVVTDIEMPNLDGFALTRKIKKDPRYAHLPVIAVTALAEDEDKAKGKAAGIDDYQVKVN